MITRVNFGNAEDRADLCPDTNKRILVSVMEKGGLKVKDVPMTMNVVMYNRKYAVENSQEYNKDLKDRFVVEITGWKYMGKKILTLTDLFCILDVIDSSMNAYSEYRTVMDMDNMDGSEARITIKNSRNIFGFNDGNISVTASIRYDNYKSEKFTYMISEEDVADIICFLKPLLDYEEYIR